MLHISCIIVTRSRSRRPRKSAQLVGVVVDAVVDAAVDAVADAKVVEISGPMIIMMGIKMIMEVVFKRGEMIGCYIAAVKIVDGILPTILELMLLGSMILILLSCHMTMTIVSCHGRLLMLQQALEPLW